ncbi:lycopene cyclase domain-containing protein [Arthrobacter livingstonensis]|uniref:Lycopene cyclase domain-containing protein n=1 Tax=Arthrobacter livingstonensis TaxID=670078 RepID=A0A2V5L1K5_9MICC|nr:lycopene cyclase domain-containing protein [Arthrobacter livingstonensis]PYI65171.1 lycopene cyclase domain-containing protein [Arthrobacter livingstonensis]
MTYLLILIVVIICIATLDARYRLFLFSRPVPALVTLLAGTGIFLLWDVIAIHQGIFLHRESPLMTRVMLAEQLPLEEAFFLFFLCYQTMVLVTGSLRWRSSRQAKKLGPTTADAKETM